EVMPKARAAALRAAEIDPALPEAHISLGIIKQTFGFDWFGAASEFERALILNPGNAEAHLWHGWTLLLMGRADEAIAEAKTAHELDPLSLFAETGLGQLFYLSGNIPAGVQTIDAVAKVDAKFFPGRYYLGVAELCAAKYQAAARELEEATRLD